MWHATHRCSAWTLQDGIRRANDGGEPGGSAGPPILAAIEGAGLVDCCVVVTRYYGGVPLGIGGLIRAYGEAAAQALALAPKRTGTLAVRFRIRYPYALTGPVMRALTRAGAAEIHHGYAPGGSRGAVEFAGPGRRGSNVSGFAAGTNRRRGGAGVAWSYYFVRA